MTNETEIHDIENDPAEPGKELRDLIQDCISPQATALIAQTLRRRFYTKVNNQNTITQIRWFIKQLIEVLGGEEELKRLCKEPEL